VRSSPTIQHLTFFNTLDRTVFLFSRRSRSCFFSELNFFIPSALRGSISFFRWARAMLFLRHRRLLFPFHVLLPLSPSRRRSFFCQESLSFFLDSWPFFWIAAFPFVSARTPLAQEKSAIAGLDGGSSFPSQSSAWLFFFVAFPRCPVSLPPVDGALIFQIEGVDVSSLLRILQCLYRSTPRKRRDSPFLKVSLVDILHIFFFCGGTSLFR